MQHGQAGERRQQVSIWINAEQVMDSDEALKGESGKAAPIAVRRGDGFVSGQGAANCFIGNYE